MILVRAPLRMSFVGGGTDLRDFYRQYPGRVISTALDKFVYIIINRTPLVPKVSARYSISESVDHPKDLQHNRIKALLLDLGIERNIEIGSFAHLPAKTGLGSSSTFSVALVKGLHAFLGKKLDKGEVAELACRLEIELCGEPIGKQDQYAAAFGGFNIIQFNPDETVEVKPLYLDFKKRLQLEDHMSLFFTGLTRSASSVLSEQKKNIDKKVDVLKKMADSVHTFAECLIDGKVESCGKMLHEGWLMKKSLASGVSSGVIDQFYEAGMKNGAWGGKVLGAGGGGCIMFLSPIEKKADIREAVFAVAKANNLKDFTQIPVSFAQSGVEILYNADHQTHILTNKK